MPKKFDNDVIELVIMLRDERNYGWKKICGVVKQNLNVDMNEGTASKLYKEHPKKRVLEEGKEVKAGNTELEIKIGQRLDKGIHPTKIIAELGHPDLVVKLTNLYKKLRADDYLNSSELLSDHGYFDSTCDEAVHIGIKRLLNDLDNWKGKSRDLKKKNTGLHNELAEREKIGKLIDELAVKKWTPKEMADYLTILYNVGAKIGLPGDAGLVINLKNAMKEAEGRGWTPKEFARYVTLHHNEICKLEEVKKEIFALEKRKDYLSKDINELETKKSSLEEIVKPYKIDLMNFEQTKRIFDAEIGGLRKGVEFLRSFVNISKSAEQRTIKDAVSCLSCDQLGKLYISKLLS